MTATALDIAIALVLLLSVIVAFFRGLIKEVFTLTGLIAAVWAAYSLGHLLVPEFEKWLGADTAEKGKLIFGVLSPALAAKVASYGGLFLFVFGVMSLLGYFISRWVKDSGLGIIDRLLGTLFGLARGFLLVFLIYVPLTYLVAPDDFPAWAKDSASVPILEKARGWANKNLQLSDLIEAKDGHITIKIDKVEGSLLKPGANTAEEDLKAAIEKEEKEHIRNVVPPETP